MNSEEIKYKWVLYTYPSIYFICWVSIIIQRLIEIFPGAGETNFLGYISYFLTNLDGFFNAIVYWYFTVRQREKT